MKKVWSRLVLILVIFNCTPSKKAQLTNSHKGIIFYSERSPFVIFYPTERKMNHKQIVSLLDNKYGNCIWFSQSKYRFAMEDISVQFDSIMIEYNKKPNVHRYAYVTANFNQPIKFELPKSVYRTKPYTYFNLSFDEFIIDNRDIKIDSLIFTKNKLNLQYLKLLNIHKNSINDSDPPPPPKQKAAQK